MMSSQNKQVNGTRCRLLFHGEKDNYELWEVKFIGYLRTLKLHEVVAAAQPDAEKNADIFAELVQLLDDTSLSLVIRDAKDKGKEALKILRDHYMGASKPRIISLWTELTSLKMATSEQVTSYMIRAETAAAALTTAGETVSDSLLIGMVLKGLPPEFKTFSTVINQRKDAMTFQEFKVALRSCEETEKCQLLNNKDEDSVMFAKQDEKNHFIKCYQCKKPGHKANKCPGKMYANTKADFKSKRWCDICKSPTHDTNYCRHNKRNANAVKSCSEANDKYDSGEDDSHSFVMKVGTVSNPVNNCHFESDKLLVDSGSSTHIVTDKSKFIKFDAKFEPVNHVIELADGSRQKGVALGKGNASINLCDTNGNMQNVILSEALYIPTYKTDIFSVRAATQKGVSVEFTPDYSRIITKDGTTFDLVDKEKLYFLNKTVDFNQSIDSICATHSINKVSSGNKNNNCQTLQQWHNILGHCNVKDVIKLEKVVKGMQITDRSDFNCETCILGKMTQYVNRTPDAKAERSLESVHCDIAGPITPLSKDGHKYAINFIDDFTGATFVYFLKGKSDAIIALERFLADSSPYGEIKRLRRDNALEFISEDFDNILVKHKIKSELSCPYSPHQNGTAERAWRTLFEMGRCLLIQSGLPKKLWPYAIKAAAYIRNRCFNPRLEITPYEALTKKVPSLSHMHTFGSECYAYVQNKKKLDPRCEKGVFLGYDSHSPAYLVYFAKESVVKKVRCVTFNEKIPKKVFEEPKVDLHHHCSPEVKKSYENVALENQNVELNDENVEINSNVESAQTERRYPEREHHKPKHLENFVTNYSAKSNIHFCYRVSPPETYEEAIESPQAKQWQKSMEEEIKLLRENDTFEETILPQGVKAIGGRWVYIVKDEPDKKERYRSRYCAKGYGQKEGIDYDETFSPTAKFPSLRMLVKVGRKKNLIVHQMDVSSAYLHANIDVVLYVEPAKGFVKLDSLGRKLFWKLKKSIYGLKQSGRNWFCLLHKFLISNNFEQSLVDPCLYTKYENDSIIIILFWVDDIIIAASDFDILNSVKKSFHEKFKMKDMGQLSWFLGIEFSFTQDCTFMSQTKYCSKILERFNMSECKPKALPSDTSINSMNVESEELADPRLYRAIIGSLIYIMVGTRPDICFTVTKLSQHMTKPTKAHLKLARN